MHEDQVPEPQNSGENIPNDRCEQKSAPAEPAEGCQLKSAPKPGINRTPKMLLNWLLSKWSNRMALDTHSAEAQNVLSECIKEVQLPGIDLSDTTPGPIHLSSNMIYDLVKGAKALLGDDRLKVYEARSCSCVLVNTDAFQVMLDQIAEAKGKLRVVTGPLPDYTKGQD